MRKCCVKKKRNLRVNKQPLISTSFPCYENNNECYHILNIARFKWSAWCIYLYANVLYIYNLNPGHPFLEHSLRNNFEFLNCLLFRKWTFSSGSLNWSKVTCWTVNRHGLRGLTEWLQKMLHLWLLCKRDLMNWEKFQWRKWVSVKGYKTNIVFTNFKIPRLATSAPCLGFCLFIPLLWGFSLIYMVSSPLYEKLAFLTFIWQLGLKIKNTFKSPFDN